jgi:hypothetical protein
MIQGIPSDLVSLDVQRLEARDRETEQDLIAKDKSGFLAWIKSGADQMTKSNIEGFRWKQIEAKLADDTHQAQIARESLAALEDEIAVLRAAIGVLDGQHPRYARGALVEHATTTKVAEYRETVARLGALAAELGGLAQIAHGFNSGYGLRQIDIKA